MTNKIKFLFAALCFGLIITSCQKDEKEIIETTVRETVDPGEILSEAIKVNYNPSGIAPLTAELEVKTTDPSTISIKVLGDVPVEKDFYSSSTSHVIPILGLYADTTNQVVVEISTANQVGRQIVEITTDSLSEYLPNIEIVKANTSLMEPGMNLNTFMATDGTNFWPYPLIFDHQGKVRWYLDFESQNKFISFRAPMELTDEGNLLFETSNAVVEYDFMGRELKNVPIPSNYDHTHHDVIKLDNGNYVIPVDFPGAQITYQGTTYNTVEDHMIEIDGTTGALVTAWDFRQILDIDRDTLVNPVVSATTADWFHQNAVIHDPRDDHFVVSGRNQGLVKLNRNNQIKWILAPHAAWGLSGLNGNGTRTDSLLLTAVDASGNPYPQAVQDGTQKDPSFQWIYAQHAPAYLPNGNLIVFDNGFNRQFTNQGPYSRAVEYKIDETNMTIQEVWSYGESRGTETFSPIISDVDYLPNTGNVLFAPGIMFGPNQNSKIVEVTRPGGNVVFESVMYFKNVRGGATQPAFGQLDITYRAERVKLYN